MMPTLVLLRVAMKTVSAKYRTNRGVLGVPTTPVCSVGESASGMPCHITTQQRQPVSRRTHSAACNTVARVESWRTSGERATGREPTHVR